MCLARHPSGVAEKDQKKFLGVSNESFLSNLVLLKDHRFLISLRRPFDK